MRKIAIAVITIFLHVANLFAQEYVSFQHYSVDDGLSQNTVMSIIQDNKGFMWFGTWDGLDKFDGHTFTIYKSRPGDHSDIATNRIDFIHEDKFGYIWFQTYDGKIHRLNPKTEEFYSLPYATNRSIYGVEREKRFMETSSGELWIATNNIGALRVTTNPKNDSVTVTEYSTFSKYHIADNYVNFVQEDSNQNVWIGTSKGLFCVLKGTYQVTSFQPETPFKSSAFYSFLNKDHSIWFGDGDGNVWRYSTKTNDFDLIPVAKGSTITAIGGIDKDHLIFTTSHAGFFIYNTATKKLSQFSKKDNPKITTNEFKSVFVDSYGVAWLEGEEPGVYRYRLSDNSVKYFIMKINNANNLSALPNFFVVEDVSKRLWVNLEGGGFYRYNRKADKLEYFYNKPGSPDYHFSNIVHSFYPDKDGNLWMCTYSKGLEKISFYDSDFILKKPNKKINSLTSNEVRAFCQLSNGDILIATKDSYIRLYDQHFKYLGILTSSGRLNEGKNFSDPAYCFFEDSQKNLWVGTKGAGVYKLTPENNDPQHPIYHVKRFENNPLDLNSLSNNNIYSIIEDSSHRILIGTFGGGINVVSKENGKTIFLNYKNKLTKYPINKCSKVRYLLEDNQNTLWVATANGLLQIDHFMEPDMKYYYIEKLPDISNSLSNNDVHYLILDKKEHLWIGTFGGGLSKLISKATANHTASFENFTYKNSLPNDIVLSIQEDSFGKLWMSSENSISMFDPEKLTFQNYNLSNGIENALFSEAASLFTRNGEMLFGCNKGYYYFVPSKLKHSKEVPRIEFTKFQLFNKDVKIGGKGSPLKQSISYTNEIKLTHKQSVFSIEYVALEYLNPEKINYAFKLENFEKNWNYVKGQRKATYTNLPKGTYYFKVKSTNNEGLWVNNEKSIKIVILPSFWETPLAYILYTLFLIGLLYLVYYLTKTFSNLRHELDIEQKVTDIKLRFFTNISHELRTPLTLILGPVENILKNEKISVSAKDQLHIVENNANRMLRLINQILDFRKIQNKKMRLKIQSIRFDQLIQEVCANFTKEALDRHIDFKLRNYAGEIFLWVDRDKTDIIIYNLLSNAFKYTADNKKIEVVIERDSNEGDVKIKVIDEGTGIPLEKKPFLFERFTSADEIHSLGNKRGSGIGLNLVKELVDLHKGTIEVESEVGTGTTFTVTFKGGKEHFGNDVDFIVEDENENEIEDNYLSNGTISDDMEIHVQPKEAPLILIVEDNDEMRSFLQKVLCKTYKTDVASDGEEGLEKALKIVPDLIVTDLMMPNMDGLELTDKVKQNEMTSHIPVILLTAKSAVESRLQALKSGADDYITKPFSPIMLEARIENIIAQRKRLQNSYRKNLLELEPAKVEIASQDEIFLAKLLDFMEKNIDNSELTVEDLVSEMAFGRTVFFNKLKGLTGLAPIEFIREMRIKRAAQLLKSGEYNVSQITYMVGMSDSRYFSKCFKKVYGMTPSEYKKNIDEND